MGKIDTSEWKEFRIKDLFETQKKGNKLQVPTGASVPVQDLLEDGATPRITVTGSNNGIFGFYDYCGKNIADYVHPQKRRVRHRLGQGENSLDRPKTPHHLFSAAVLYEVHPDRNQTHHPAWLL